MLHAIRYVCLLVAGLAFLSFTFAPAQAQLGPRDRVQGQDPRPLRVEGSDPAKPSSGPLAPKPEPPKVGEPGAKNKMNATKFVQIKKDEAGKPLALQTAI